MSCVSCVLVAKAISAQSCDLGLRRLNSMGKRKDALAAKAKPSPARARSLLRPRTVYSGSLLYTLGCMDV